MGSFFLFSLQTSWDFMLGTPIVCWCACVCICSRLFPFSTKYISTENDKSKQIDTQKFTTYKQFNLFSLFVAYQGSSSLWVLVGRDEKKSRNTQLNLLVWYSFWVKNVWSWVLVSLSRIAHYKYKMFISKNTNVNVSVFFFFKTEIQLCNAIIMIMIVHFFLG